MNRGQLENYKIEVEINTLESVEILNLCTRNRIFLSNVRKVNRALIEAQIFYRDYEDLKKIVKRCGGKIKIKREMGNLIKVKKIKKRFSFFLGGILFVLILFFLSTRIWGISITTEKNVTPFEIREVLSEMGVEQGISKRNVNLYEIEKALETKCNEILWVRVRIEGSILTVNLKEKVNPPKFLEEHQDDIVAKMDGEVTKIYSEKGKAVVENGSLVKEGDVLIEGVQKEEGGVIEARGTVIANTFYTKETEILIDGVETVLTGKKEEEIYLEILDKKIYLKKFSKSFQNYDKIESNNGIIKKVTYKEKSDKHIKLDRETEIQKTLENLEKLLIKELPIDAKIKEKKHQVIEGEKGKIKVIGEFAVEQNIANR